MNSNILKFLVLFALIVLFAFFRTFLKNNEKKIINIDIDKIISEKPLYYSDLFSGFHIVPLEIDSSSLFSNIDKLRIINDTIYVFDRFFTKSLYIFSKDGKFVNKISKIGHGIGEYLSPSDFDFDVNLRKLLIFDNRYQNINYYTVSGEFYQKIHLNNVCTSLITCQNSIYLYKQPIKNSKEKVIFIYDRKRNKNSEVLNSSIIKRKRNVLEILPNGNFFLSKNDIKFFSPYCDTIFSITDRKVRPFIILNTEKYKLTKNELMGQSVNNINNKLLGVSNYSENDSIAFFKFFIGMKQYYVIYNFKTKSASCFNKLIDDVTNLTPELIYIKANQFISFIDIRQIQARKEVLASKFIAREHFENNKILDSKQSLILIYEFKK